MDISQICYTAELAQQHPLLRQAIDCTSQRGSPTLNSMSVPTTVRPTLLALVEEHVTSLIRDALTVQRHCKRARLNHDGAYKQRLHAADINMALQLQGSEKLYGVIQLFPQNPTSDANAPPGSSTLTADPQQMVLLTDVLKEEMPPAPTEVVMKQHWLAIDGVQPDIPENPESFIGAATTGGVAADIATITESSEVTLRVHQLQAGLLSEELKLYFLRGVATLERGSASQDDRNEQDAVLANLARDAGLQELVPFFVRYAQHAIYEHLTINTDHCKIMVRLIRSLLHNPTLHLELHLHELLPALMTCVVAQTLGSEVGTSGGDLYHWSLRHEAATALYECCALFGTEYATLKSRVLRALCQALGDVSLPSRYGGTVAITYFGCRAIDAFLLPTVLDNWLAWESDLESTTLPPELEMEIIMCQQAVLTGIGTFLRGTDSAEKHVRLAETGLDEVFADRMMILSGEETEYAMCFV
jgi:transcription initiation factor TFIID subunit 6